MGIKNFEVRLAEVGKIKIGGLGDKRKGQNGSDYRIPKKFDHFVVTTTERDKNGDLTVDQSIMKELGEKPKELSIRLLFDDEDMNFFTSYQYYAGKKCICRGDGENAQRKITTNKEDVKKGKDPVFEIKPIKCDPKTCEFMKAGKCKVCGILSCLLTKFPSFGGCYRFRTHSYGSVNNIMAALKFFKANTNGVLQGLPLKLIFLKKATEDHGNVDTVGLVLDNIELANMRQLAADEYVNRQKLGVNIKAYEATIKAIGFLEDKDPENEVAAEFYEEDPATPEKPKKGVTADDLKGKLENKKVKPVEKTAEPTQQEVTSEPSTTDNDDETDNLNDNF